MATKVLVLISGGDPCQPALRPAVELARAGGRIQRRGDAAERREGMSGLEERVAASS